MDFNAIRKTIDKYDTPKYYNTFRKLINGNTINLGNLGNLLHYQIEGGIEYYPSAIVVLAIILDRKISEVINHCKYFKVHLKTINRSNDRSLQISAYLSRNDFELSVDRFIPILHILNDFTQKFPGIGFYRLWQIEFENVTVQDMPDSLKHVIINPNEVPKVLRTEEDEKRIAQRNKDKELKSLECSTIGSNPETINVTPAKVDIKIEPINTIKLT